MTSVTLLSALVGTLLVGLGNSTARSTPVPGYLVLTSRATETADGWHDVVESLAAKHDAEVLVFEREPEEMLEALRERRPNLIGVVLRPEESGRARVGELHRLFRRIDDDPYLDARWGLVTAADAADAMKVVAAEKPLLVESALSNTPIPSTIAARTTAFDEGVAGRRVDRLPGGRGWPIQGDPITADDFARAFDRLQPDLMVTSGRTNEERWMIGYTFDGGRVIVDEAGRLLARTPDGVEHPMAQPGPMAMLGAGSCLLGYVPDASVLPLAFIKHAGARQIVGYASATWYGAGGWDLYRRFLESPGRHTLAESTWIAQQDLIHQFERRFPDQPIVSTAGFSEREVPEFRVAVEEATGIERDDDRFDDLSGYLWDRDAMVLLGDPAWRVELAPGDLPWVAEVYRHGDRLYLDLTVRADLSEASTPAVIIDPPIDPRGIVESAGLEPVVLDDLVFLPGLRELSPGASVTVVLDAPLRDAAAAAAP